MDMKLVRDSGVQRKNNSDLFYRTVVFENENQEGFHLIFDTEFWKGKIMVSLHMGGIYKSEVGSDANVIVISKYLSHFLPIYEKFETFMDDQVHDVMKQMEEIRWSKRYRLQSLLSPVEIDYWEGSARCIPSTHEAMGRTDWEQTYNAAKKRLERF
jgi:hypothetical protein